jgi:hypothetical protein
MTPSRTAGGATASTRSDGADRTRSGQHRGRVRAPDGETNVRPVESWEDNHGAERAERSNGHTWPPGPSTSTVFGGEDCTAQGSCSIAMRCALPICTIISCCKTFDLSVIAEQSISGNQGSVIRVRSILGLIIHLTSSSEAVHRPGYSTHLASPLVFSLPLHVVVFADRPAYRVARDHHGRQ